MRRPHPGAVRIAAALFAVALVAAALLLPGVGPAAAQDLPSGPPAGESPAEEVGQAAEDGNESRAPGRGENPFPRRSAAPGLEGGTDWLNSAGEITLRDLRGKVVVLDFWTYCCINCMHVLPDLEYLEKKYPNELVVIGVHSAKFDNEKDSQAIRDAILRYEIAHPVINDAEMVLWRKYEVRAWPTLVLIDPEGYYVGFASGEGNRQTLDEAIGRLIAFHEAKGTLDRSPVRFDLERHDEEATPLRFPGKVLADAGGKRLFISDSNHNRIVVTTLEGELLDVIGSGRMGRADGSYAEAEFDHPQGMALEGQTLYVADTENHLIRAVDLESKAVSTLAGTGEQGSWDDRAGGPRLATRLNSPWDLIVHREALYIAMAGTHQIWSHKLGSELIGPFAGTGREDVLDGAPTEAAFAQPSGLATDGTALFVCDSEGSAIRRVPFDIRQPVTTIAGASDLPAGRSLFTFGDEDGVAGKARLQHPLGIALRGGQLMIADSYNHKLKTIRLERSGVGRVSSFLGTGEAGAGLDPVQFSEPGGLAVAGNTMFVADTNNHRVVRVDLKTKKAEVLTISGLEPPQSTETPPLAASAEPDAKPTPAEGQTVRPAEVASVSVDLTLPADYKLNPAFPLGATISAEGSAALVAPEATGKRITASAEGETVRFALPLTGQGGTTTVRIKLTYGYCREGKGGLCKVRTAEWLLPLTVADGGAEGIRLTAPPAEPGTGG